MDPIEPMPEEVDTSTRAEDGPQLVLQTTDPQPGSPS